MLNAIVAAAAGFAGDDDSELDSTKSLCKIPYTFSGRGRMLGFEVSFSVCHL